MQYIYRIVRAGGCPVVIDQWQSTGCTSQVFWVRFPATASFVTFLYFHLITSEFSLPKLLPCSSHSMASPNQFTVFHLSKQKLHTVGGPGSEYQSVALCPSPAQQPEYKASNINCHSSPFMSTYELVNVRAMYMSLCVSI